MNTIKYIIFFSICFVISGTTSLPYYSLTHDNLRETLSAFPKELSDPLGGGLADALADIDLQDISLLPAWKDVLLFAIMDLPISQQVEGVLNAWLPKNIGSHSFG